MAHREWKTIKEYQDILFDFYEGIARITINRPRYRNAFTPDTTKELSEAFYICRERQDIHVVILTGAGISAESGLATFRSSNGLWNNHRVEDVASVEGFERNRKFRRRNRNVFERFDSFVQRNDGLVVRQRSTRQGNATASITNNRVLTLCRDVNGNAHDGRVLARIGKPNVG